MNMSIQAEMNGTLVKRSDVVAYYGVPGEEGAVTYTRMQGFTEQAKSKNPIEYSRQYVDESFERTDTTGYSTSMSFAFDRYKDNPVHEDMVQMADSEATGSDTVREIVLVDFSDPVNETNRQYHAKKRAFTTIFDSEGNETNAYTYSGNFRAAGTTVSGTATVAADGRTLTFAAAAGNGGE